MIRNIWAVGRNYADHSHELGNAVPAEPLIFLKAGSSAFFGSEITLPSWTQEVHHEIELALKFGDDLRISDFGLALDLTERRLQGILKAKGQPWTLAKSFTGACPLTAFHAVENPELLGRLDISLSVNGQNRQRGKTSDMIFSAPHLVEFVLAHFPVEPGDLLLTGTPSGVGPIYRGDRLEASLTSAGGERLRHFWNVI